MPLVEVLGAPELLEFRRPPELEEFFVLSPFAMCLRGRYEMLLRLVNRDEDTGAVLPADDAYANAKEAALISTSRGIRMFFEYARDGASRLGVADALQLSGPWTYGDSPMAARSDAFDSWHLSPCAAIRRDDGTHVLFYNGASKQTAWRVNYALLDETATVVFDRPKPPLVTPFGLEDGDTDIAFAASALVDSTGNVWLYYSIADRKPYRCRLRVAGATRDSATR